METTKARVPAMCIISSLGDTGDLDQSRRSMKIMPRLQVPGENYSLPLDVFNQKPSVKATSMKIN